MTRDMASELRADRRRIAAATVETVIESGRFSWTEHWNRTLLSLDLQPVSASLPHGSFRPAVFSYAYLRLLDAVEQALRHRQPRAVFLENAHHLFGTAQEDIGTTAAHAISGLAKRTMTPHVLIGAYDMLRHIPEDFPLRVIELRRYRWHDVHDRRFFRSIVADVATMLPGRVEAELTDGAEYLYERSAGCIGTLRDWLVRALYGSMSSGAGGLAWEHMEAAAPGVAESATIAADAIAGEQSTAELRNRLYPPLPLQLAAAS